MVIPMRRKAPSGKKPLPANPAQWQSIGTRALAAILQKHADKTGDDMAQVEADALYQAQMIGMFGVPRRHLDAIQKAAAFNLESRPHASIPGSAPIGEPKEHAGLARSAERLLGVAQQLQISAKAQLQGLQAGTRGSETVLAWLNGRRIGKARLDMITRSRQVIGDFLNELTNNGRQECQCKVCRQIADGLRWSEKAEREIEFTFAAIQDAIEEAKYRDEWGYDDLPKPPPPAGRKTSSHHGRQPLSSPNLEARNPGGPTAERRQQIERDLADIRSRLQSCRGRVTFAGTDDERLENYDQALQLARREQDLLAEEINLANGGVYGGYGRQTN